MQPEDFNDRARPPPTDHRKELVKLLSGLCHRHDRWRVYSDFCEMAAISLSNAVDRAQYGPREARYMQIVKAYTRDEVNAFPKALGHLVEALEQGPSDVLGHVFHELELHNKYTGQFFTPFEVCRMMAKMTIGDCTDLRERIAARGFVTAQEPAVGTGAMVIALADEMREAGINYQQHLHVTAIDVDAKCVHAAYVQFALLHIPAVIVHGNTLSLQEWSHWYTPAHILDGWQWKLRRQAATDAAYEMLTPRAQSVHVLPTVDARTENKEEDEPPGPPRQMTLF